MPDAFDGTVYLELLVRGSDAIRELMDAMPRGANVQAYLTPTEWTTESEPRLIDPDAGRPLGQPLWNVRLGSGFVLWNEQGLFVPEIDAWSDRGLTVDDFAPDRTVNPPLPDGTPFPTADTTVEGEPMATIPPTTTG